MVRLLVESSPESTTATALSLALVPLATVLSTLPPLPSTTLPPLLSTLPSTTLPPPSTLESMPVSTLDLTLSTVTTMASVRLRPSPKLRLTLLSTPPESTLLLCPPTLTVLSRPRCEQCCLPCGPHRRQPRRQQGCLSRRPHYCPCGLPCRHPCCLLWSLLWNPLWSLRPLLRQA